MIKLDEFYRVEEDSHSWNLVYEKQGDINPNTGKPKLSSDVSYHANLRQALSWYLHKSQSGSTTIHEAVTAMLEAEERINNAK